MKSKHFLWFFCIVLGQAKGVEKSERFIVEIKDLTHFQISVEKGLSAVLPGSDRVLTLPKEGSFFIQSVYNPLASEPDLGFGDKQSPFAGSERIVLEDNGSSRTLRGLARVGDAIFMFDNNRWQILQWDPKRSVPLLVSDLVLDFIRPAADGQGEPTQAETSRLRKLFSQALKSWSPPRAILAGMIALPKTWRDKDGSQFLVLLRIKGFPLATLRCSGENNKYCRLERACFVRGIAAHEIDNFSGLGYSEEMRELWIGQRKPPSIIRMQASSCYSISRKSKDFMPQELRELSSIALDGEGRLWATSFEPDLARSASLFIWKKMNPRGQ